MMIIAYNDTPAQSRLSPRVQSGRMPGRWNSCDALAKAVRLIARIGGVVNNTD